MSKIAVIFPGQGTQIIGMGKDLYDNYPIAKEMFEKADEIFGESISSLCFNGPEELLKKTLYQQVAIYVVSAIAYTIFKDYSAGFTTPAYYSGLSLGEYSALFAAGAISFEDGLKLVQKRAQYMQSAAENNASGMIAVIGANKEDLEEFDGKDFFIANLNCPGQVVVSVEAAKMDDVIAKLIDKGFKRVIPLEVSGGFHSPFMKEAEENLAKIVESTPFNDIEIPVICNIDAKPYTDAASLKNNLVKQLTGSVLWWKSVDLMKNNDVTTFYEVGPNKVLKGILRKIDRSLVVENKGVASDF